MDGNDSDKVILLEPAAVRLRDEFVAWQCRIRQIAVRELGGRPSPGMRPRVVGLDGAELSASVVVLLNRAEPADIIKLFRHQVLKTFDPVERYDKVLEILAAAYFQHPGEFSDSMTALFGPASPLVEQLMAAQRCILEFSQFSQSYRLPCAIAHLSEADEAFQATYWHNRLFNDTIPAGIEILSFTPDWTRASGARGS